MIIKWGRLLIGFIVILTGINATLYPQTRQELPQWAIQEATNHQLYIWRLDARKGLFNQPNPVFPSPTSPLAHSTPTPSPHNAPPDASDNSPRVMIHQVIVTGSTVISHHAIRQQITPYLHKWMNETTWVAMLTKLNEWVISNGWITTRVVPRSIQQGVLTLEVVAGGGSRIFGITPLETWLAFGQFGHSHFKKSDVERGISRLQRLSTHLTSVSILPDVRNAGVLNIAVVNHRSGWLGFRYDASSESIYQPASIDVVLDRPFQLLDRLEINYTTTLRDLWFGSTSIQLTESLPVGPWMLTWGHGRLSHIQVLEGKVRHLVATGLVETHQGSLAWECARDGVSTHTITMTAGWVYRHQFLDSIELSRTLSPIQWQLGWDWVLSGPYATLVLSPSLMWDDQSKLYRLQGQANWQTAWGTFHLNWLGQYGDAFIPPVLKIGIGNGSAMPGFFPAVFASSGWRVGGSHRMLFPWVDVSLHAMGCGLLGEGGGYWGVRVGVSGEWRWAGWGLQMGAWQGVLAQGVTGQFIWGGSVTKWI